MGHFYTSERPPRGNTPLIRLDNMFSDTPQVQVFAKLEQFNMAGSAKDRTAEALVTTALEQGIIGSGSTLVESSSGNLGIALARQAALHDMHFHCVVDPRVNSASVTIMRTMGATVDMVEHPDPATGDWLTARRTRVAELLEEIPDAVNLDQYSNRAAFRAHAEGTMTEILADMDEPPTHLLVAMSTTGTIGGCRQKIDSDGLDTTVIGVDAVGSILYGGDRGARLLPGYGAGVTPELSRDHRPDDVVRVTDVDAVIGARRLAHSEGYLPGASGGAVIAVAEKLAANLASPQQTTSQQPARIAIVIHDGGAAYINTIYSDSWVAEKLQVTPEELDERVYQGEYSWSK